MEGLVIDNNEMFELATNQRTRQERERAELQYKKSKGDIINMQ